MPKKPLTAYSFWAHDERLRWVQANPNVDKRDLTRHLRTKWNSLSPDEKAVRVQYCVFLPCVTHLRCLRAYVHVLFGTLVCMISYVVADQKSRRPS